MIDNDDFIDYNNWIKIKFIENDQWNIWQKTKTNIQTNAKKTKYNLIIRRSNINKFIEKTYKITFVCNRNVTYKTKFKKKSTSTKHQQ